LRKPLTWLTLVLLISAGMYLTGVFTSSSVEKLLGIDGPIRRGPQQGRGQELNTRGVNQLDAGNPAAAVAALREARFLEPDSAVIKRNLSIALARRASELPGDEETAMALLRESLQMWPKNPEGLDGLSSIHFQAGRYREALEPAMILKKMMPDRKDLSEYVGHLQKKIADEQGMTWEKGDHFRLLYSDQRKLEYEGEVLSILQTQLDSLTAALGLFPDRPIDVLLLTEDLGTRADPLDPFLDGLYDGQIRLYIGEDIEDRQKLVLTVRHEMVHALLHRGIGNLPGWVQEGLAQKTGEEPDENRLAAVRSYVAGELRKGYHVDLDKMGISFITLDRESRTRAYATSLLFMDYLARAYGEGFIPGFVAEMVSGAPPREALKTLTGSGFEQLQASFSSDIAGGS